MKKTFQTGKVITVSFGHLVHDTYSAFLAPMLPLLIAKLGISLSMAGLLDVTRKIPSLFTPPTMETDMPLINGRRKRISMRRS